MRLKIPPRKIATNGPKIENDIKIPKNIQTLHY